MEENIWIYIISPLVTAFLSWFFTRRQYKQEIKKLELDNNEGQFEYLKKLNQDLEERVDALNNSSEKLFNQVLALTEENRQLKIQVELLRNSITNNNATED